MWRIVNSFETKGSNFAEHSYLFHDDTYVCEIKDYSLFNDEILHMARYINQYLDDQSYTVVE